jgi:murein DD-endopeptidase MepM/ murein hydrolase activator NlpD
MQAQTTREDLPPIAVEFPLQGEWVAAHTPAERVPSHGTDQLGQRYAYDFLRIVQKSGAEVYAFLAHARCGSIRVAAGQPVRAGQELAQVGHSGNSTAPHLHLHLMDGPDLLAARGLPCCFQHYQALQGGHWVPIVNGLPGKRQFIRHGA